MPPSNHQPADRWLFALVCVLTLWLPIPLGSNRPWSMDLLQIMTGILATITGLLILTHRLQINPVVYRAAPAIFLLFAIPLWTAIQLVPLPPHGQAISLNTSLTFIFFQKSLCYSLLFVVLLQLINTPGRLRTFALVIVSAGLIQACYGLLVSMGGKDFDILHIRSSYAIRGDATGTFINRNHLAGYLELCLAVGIGLMIAGITQHQESGSWRARLRELLRAFLGEKARVRLFLVAMVIALVMTHSRGGNTAFFASMGICAVIGYLIYRHYSRSMVLLFGSMIAIDVFIVSSWFGLERLAERIEQTNIERESRLEVANLALRWIQDHWLSGSGAGSFTTTFPAYRDNSIIGFYDFTHNDYLQIFGEYGFIGAALFAGFALLTLWTAIQAQRQRQHPLMRGMAFAAMMGLISLAIHSSTDFNLYIPANASLLTMVCALAYVARHLNPHGSQHKKQHHRKAVVVTNADD